MQKHVLPAISVIQNVLHPINAFVIVTIRTCVKQRFFSSFVLVRVWASQARPWNTFLREGGFQLRAGRRRRRFRSPGTERGNRRTLFDLLRGYYAAHFHGCYSERSLIQENARLEALVSRYLFRCSLSPRRDLPMSSQVPLLGISSAAYISRMSLGGRPSGFLGLQVPLRCLITRLPCHPGLPG